MYPKLKLWARYALVAMLLMTSPSLFAQQRVVTGKVVNSETGNAMPGVSISVKGIDRAVLSDENGNFSIEVPSTDSYISFTHVGFSSQEIKAGNKSVLSISMDVVDKQLEELIYVGYSSQKKGLMTNAVEPVDMKAIRDLPVGSLGVTLRGQINGLSVSGGQARPGGPPTLNIRDAGSFTKSGGSVEPLFVVDDVVKTSEEFNLLDVSEIESITVLKDASAAIYGVNGNQGAIVVKTKRGQAGPPRVSYAGSLGFTDAAGGLPKMMNGYELATYLNDYNIERGQGTSTGIYTEDELEYFKSHNYDWLDMAWQTSVVNRQTLNVSGGSDKATYFAGVSYNSQDGNLKKIFSDRWTYRAGADIKLTTGFKVGMQVSGSFANSKMYWLKQGGENTEKDMIALLQTPQFNPPYINGLPVLLTSATNSNSENFHFFEVQNSDNYTKSTNSGLNVNLNATWEIPFIKGLSAKAAYNRNLSNSFGKQYGTSYNVYQFDMLGGNNHIYGGDIIKSIKLKNGDMLRFNPSYTKNYQLNASLNFNRTFGLHTIGAYAMMEQRESYMNGVATYIEQAIQGGRDNMDYFTGTTILQSEDETEQGYLSYLGRLSYSYADKYLFDFILRADASSNFAPEYRWGYFPAVSAGWIVSNESFFNSNAFNFLKLRGSVGLTGGDRTSAFQWYLKYKKETGKGAVFGGEADRDITIVQDGLVNRYVRWDDKRQVDVGIDAEFLNNRLSVSLDGYHNHGYNILMTLNSSVSLVTGETPPTENFGIINNFGTELTIGWKNNINRNWSYNIKLRTGLSDNKNIKVDVNQGLIGSPKDPTGRSSDQGVEGYRYAGMFRTQEEVNAFLAKNPGYTIFGQTPKPGMLYYEDISGPKVGGNLTEPDGKITEDDQEYLTRKSGNPYGIGLNFNIAYKSLSIGIVAGSSWGGQSSVEGEARKIAKNTINRPAFWADHWTPDNINAAYPNPYYTDSYDRMSSFWFRSSTNISISTLNISYELPKFINNKLGVSSTRFYVVGINPFELYNPYKDYRGRNNSYNVYPVLKSWSIGLNVGF